MRSASSPAALRVNVRPSTSSRRTTPLATSQTTRPAIVSVLPLPAPATTRAGSSGDSMTAACSGVGGNWPSAAATASALIVAVSVVAVSVDAAGVSGTPASVPAEGVCADAVTMRSPPARCGCGRGRTRSRRGSALRRVP